MNFCMFFHKEVLFVVEKVLFERKSRPFEMLNIEKLAPETHFHPECEMIFVIGGEALVFVNGREYKIGKGDAVFISPNQIHRYVNMKDGSYILIVFPLNIFGQKKLFGLDECVPDNNVVRYADCNRITEILCMFKDDYDKTRENSELLFAGYISLLFYFLMPRFKLKRIEHSEIVPDILKYCYKNYRNEITLEKISRSLNVNKYYISRVFNETFSMNINSFINYLRTSAAATELIETDKTVTEIAFDVGYANIRTFVRVFKNIYGMSAIEFRNKHREYK